MIGLAADLRRTLQRTDAPLLRHLENVPAWTVAVSAVYVHVPDDGSGGGGVGWVARAKGPHPSSARRTGERAVSCDG